MSFKKLDTNLNIHQSLPDQPTLSAEELKEKFDEAGNVIKDFINEHITELEEKGVFKEGETYIYPKKIIANGGIEGDVKGNLEGNAETATTASNCSGNANTATTADSAKSCTRKFINSR